MTATSETPVITAGVPANEGRLGFGTKMFYGVGSVAFGAASLGLSAGVLQPYLNRVIGLPALWVSAAIMLTLMADAILDPIIGQWSDNLRSRWGRRHPFMYVAIPLIGITVYLFWNSPQLPLVTLGFYLIGMLVLMRISISLFEVPNAAMAPELTSDYHERTVLLSFRYFFGVLAPVVMTFLLYRVFLSGPEGVLSRDGYAAYGVVSACVMVLFVSISALGTHRLISRMPKPAVRPVTLATTLREMKVTLTNRSLLTVMCSGLLSGIATGMSSSLTQYFQIELWRLQPAQIAFLAPAGLLGTVVAVFLATPVSKAFGKKRAMISLFSIGFITSLIPLTLRLMGLLPGDGTPLVFWVLFIDSVIVSALGIGGYIVVASMIADVVEDAAVKSGVRSEGLLLAANGLLPKFTAGIGVFTAGILLTVVQFPQGVGQGQVDPAVMRHLALIYLPVSAVMTALAIGVLSFYRIDKDTHERNVATLRDAATAAAAAADLGQETGSPSDGRPSGPA